MVYKLQKVQNTEKLFVMSPTSEELNRENRGKSPSRIRKITPPSRTNSVERKFKLIKKKSSKEKEQLIKGHALEAKNEINNNSICECPKITAPKSKNKVNKIWKNSKLFDAILDDDFSLARQLIVVDGMDVNEYSPEGNTLLHIASATGNIDCLELLLECGAKINCSDTNCRTPLEYAVIYGNFDCASLLIENGADPNVIKNGIL